MRRSIVPDGYTKDSSGWYVSAPASSAGNNNLMENLLSEPVCADVVFEIGHERIFAHKCVLAAASDALKAMVTGPWLENQNTDGICYVKSAHSAMAIKTMLLFVYSNNTKFMVKRDELSVSFDEIFDLAALYGFPELASACEVMGINWLKQEVCSPPLVAEIIVAAYKHEQQNLINACIDYIKTKGPRITMTRAFVDISVSYPDVWGALYVDLGVPADDEPLL